MKGWLKYLNGTLAGLMALTSPTIASCKPNETDNYATQLNLPKEDRAIISQLEYDDNTEALLSEISNLTVELQVSERVLNYLKDISTDKKVTNGELDGFKDLDKDRIKNTDELKYGTDPLKPNPNVKYALDKGITGYIEEIKPLDGNGEMNYNKRHLIDELYVLHTEVQIDAKTLSILNDIVKDGNVTSDELFSFMDLDQDGVSNTDELSVYQTHPLVAEMWDDFDTLTKILDTPEKISNYLKNNIRYKSDEELYGVFDYAATAREFFEEGGGDCEDATAFGVYCLKKGGFDAKGLAIYGPGFEPNDGHMIIFYIDKRDKLLYCIDTNYRKMGQKSGPFKTIKDIAKFISPSYTEYEIRTGFR